MRMQYGASNLLLFVLILFTISHAFVRLNNEKTIGSSEPIRGVNLGGWLVTEQW